MKAIKTLSAIWFITAVFVVPCVINVERFDACAFMLGNLILSFMAAKKFNPNLFV